MATSNTIFNSPQVNFVITEAFERIGSVGDLIVPQQIESATRSLNLILSTWANRGWNLFTTRYSMLYLENNKKQYTLPEDITDILQVLLRTSVRQLSGIAFSTLGGGTAPALAFDNNPATACTQVVANGNIAYAWTTDPLIIAPFQPQAIYLVGVQSNVTRNYTLEFEYTVSATPLVGTYNTARSVPVQEYAANKIVWFEIPVPVTATAFRIRETGGETLDIQELYFNNQISDYIVSRISHFNYMAIPNKFQVNRPTSFYYDRQISPDLYLWGVPGVVPDVPLPPAPTQYNCLLYSWKEAIQDIGTLLNNPAIPQRFLEALCAELAYRLAVKYAPDKVALLQPLAAAEFDAASREDTERVSMYIYGTYGGYTMP